ncbi:metallophosphoesterase [Pedobacter sp. PAMC26386]|nr:metallophosphoesterase [Pedobacter sp. PAMC26386]
MKLTRRKFVKIGVGTSALLLVSDAFWFEKAFIETNEFHLNKKPGHTPGIKVIQVSDLHLKSITGSLKTLADKISDSNPDLIFLTGDAIDDAGKLNVLGAFLKLLGTKIKKVAILGNWEYWSKVDLNALNSLYKSYNCDLLINEANQYTFREKTILVTGVDDYVGGKSDITSALTQFKPSDYHVILNHCPEYSDVMASSLDKSNQADLILSGHTHGGQINILGIAPFLPQGSGQYINGWYEVGETKMYVSKGIGTSMFPIRFGSRAEIAVFHL